MRRRVYWLLPDSASARRTRDELLLARIDEGHMHFFGAEGADLSGLHQANILQTSDMVPAAQIGLIVGAALGAAIGAVIALSPLMPFAQGHAALAAVMAAVGAVFGVWASSMIGSSIPSRRLTRFTGPVEHGQILLMVDVPKARVEEIEALLEKTHPELHFEGVEPNMPAFP
jgi:hypothetical protein